MTSMARFTVPAVPGDWRGREAFRIVDPLGLSAAWVAPENAGVPVGCYFRPSAGEQWLTGWESLAPISDEAADTHGCQVLLQGAGAGQGPRAWDWQRVWRYRSRDPTSVTVTGDLDDHMVTITSSCEDGGVRLQLARGSESDIRAGFRLNLREVDLDRSELTSTGATVMLESGVTMHCTPASNLLCVPRPMPRRRSLQLNFVTPPAGGDDPLVEEPIELRILPVWRSIEPGA